jgi:adenylate cyclase
MDSRGRTDSQVQLAQWTQKRLRLVATLSNLAGAALVFFLLAGAASEEYVPQARRGELAVFVLLVVLVWLAVGVGIVERRLRPVCDAVRDGEPLTGTTRRALFTMPRRIAVTSSLAWLLGGVAVAVYGALRLDSAGGGAVAVFALVALGGLTTGAVVYILLERVLRLLFVLAFKQQEPLDLEGVAVRPRLTLAWLLGTGIPMLVVAIVITDPEADASQIRLRALPWVVVAIAVSAVITVLVARSVAEPLAALRGAMAEVRRGELGVRTEVDDATEVGLLQSGFNQMVGGLAEREQLRDLFGRHVGEAVARQALARGTRFRAEKIDATALYVDLVGSTTLAETRDPIEVVDLLNEFFGVVVTTVEAEGGWINKFEGDAALCVFGPPATYDDHADRGLRAAIIMNGRLKDLASAHAGIDAGLGISSGPVVAGNVGTASRFEYTIMGDAVNEAARLADLAKDRSSRVLASGGSLSRSNRSEGSRWTCVGDVRLRGRSAATQLWEPATAATFDR